ncbi:MAG TPA: hypothetical protein DIU00_06795 [Phycisphaerales bacterium]|nr:hypothetical protein [Phycisphaerales bacterium]
MQRPFTLWPLLFFLLFLSLGGLYGGIAMLADPTGGSLQLTDTLPLLPVSDYILPGIFLLVVMGLVPLMLTYGLLARPKWRWAERLSRWSGHHWAWTGTLGLGVTLAVWLIVEGLLIGFKWAIQYTTAVDGLLIMLFVLLPGVRKFYAEM